MKTISCHLLLVFFSIVLVSKVVRGKPTSIKSVDLFKRKGIQLSTIRNNGHTAAKVPCFLRTLGVRKYPFVNHKEDRNENRFEVVARAPWLPASNPNENNRKLNRVSYHEKRIRPMNMALLPIPVESLEQILTSRLPTPAQYASYWGRTSREQYNAGFEAFGVSFLGVFAAYFLSFAIGQFVATIMGMIAGSWFLLGPELKAYQRNWELTSGRDLVDPWVQEDDEDYDFDEDKRGLYGAFYLGRIEHVCVVDYPSDLPEDEYSLDDFEGYTMENDDQEREMGIPYSLRLRVTDSTDFEEGRELQIHTRMSEEYLDLEVGMPVCAVLLSTSQRFQSLSAITDFCVPDAGPCWVGDYPYLDRPALEEMFVKDDELWDFLRDEGRGKWDIHG